jgi:phasin family protein
MRTLHISNIHNATGINHPLNTEEQPMFSNAEQFTSATKTLFASQIAAFQALSSKTFEGVEKAIALNIAAAKASLKQSSAVAKQLSSAKDPQEFFSLTTAQAKLNAENVASYNRHLTDIVSGIRAEFTKAAETQFADTKSKITTLVDTVTKNAPAGSENTVALMKSAIDNASAGYEQLTKATQQAAETVEAHVIDASEKFSHAVEKTASVEKATPKAAKQ